MPLSILTGKKDIMKLLEKEVFFFSTFGGEALSLAAAKATIEEMRGKNVIAYLAIMGKQLKDGYNDLAAKLDMPYTNAMDMIAVLCLPLMAMRLKLTP